MLSKYFEGYNRFTQQYILCKGDDGVAAAESLLKANGSWSLELGDEIFVFSTNGTWVKDHALWLEVQKADWDDVILDEGFKKKLQKDVYGFFKSEETYKRLAIPWKRGIIMHGPPGIYAPHHALRGSLINWLGNGKTISLKAVMKSVQKEGHYPLYVRTFKSKIDVSSLRTHYLS